MTFLSDRLIPAPVTEALHLKLKKDEDKYLIKNVQKIDDAEPYNNLVDGSKLTVKA
jgi:hypothetical protein